MSLDGPSRTIRIEPVEQPERRPVPERREAPVPAPPREPARREPEPAVR